MLTMDLNCGYDSFVTARAVMERQNSKAYGGQTASYTAGFLCPVGGSVCPSASQRLSRSLNTPYARVLNHWTPNFKIMCLCGLRNIKNGVKTMTQLVNIINNQVKTTSLIVADTFGKRHDNVIQKIETLECPQNFTDLNFKVSEYIDETGRKLKSYEITRDGFTLLAMGFTGKKAMEFKIKYINAFNEMEKALMDKHARFAELPFDPVPYTPADFVGDKEFMKALGGMVKKCCAVAIKDAFTGLAQKEPVKVTWPQGKKLDESLMKVATAILDYGQHRETTGRIQGMLTAALDPEFNKVKQKLI